MLQFKNLRSFFALIPAMLLINCNQPSNNSEEDDADTTAVTINSDTSDMPAYDPAMDPLTVGAAFSKKWGDTLNMKIFETTLKPGDSVAMHTHPDHAFYVLQGGKIEVTFKGAAKQEMELKPGMGWIGGPATDFGKNIGNTTVKWVETDVYRPRTGNDASMIQYDPQLDPLLVGGSSSEKLGDTLNMKMFVSTIKAGQKVPWHAHPDHSIYVLQGGKFAYTPKGGTRQEGEFTTGTGWINAPITDSAENTGNKDIKILEVDVYRPRGK